VRKLLSLAFLLPFPVLAAGVDVTIPRIGPAPHPIVGAAIASNGRSFLTVWNATVGGRNALYASPSGTDGRPTTAESVHVANLDDGSFVSLLALGDDYVILARDAGGSSMFQVSKDGHLQRRLHLAFNILDVAWNGQRFLGIERATAASSTKVVLFDLEGQVIARNVLTASTAISFDVTAVGSEFVVVASDTGGGVVAHRVASVGSILSSTLVASGSMSSSAVRVVARGSDVLAVWARAGQIETVILRAGSVVHPSPIATFATNATPVAVATPGGYAVFWNESDHFEMVRFTANGERLDQVPLGLNRGRMLDGAAVGNLVEVIFGGETVPLWAGWFLSDTTTPTLTTASIANLRSRQVGPAIASDGQAFLTAWIDIMGSDRAVMVARFGRNSPSLDGSGIRLGATNAVPQFQRPARAAVAFGGGRYLVVWPDVAKLNGTFVPLAGGPPEPAFVIRDKDVRDPAVVWNGSEFFVVFSEGRVFGSRVSATGMVSEAKQLSPDLPAHPSGWTESQPDVAWNGSEYLATWLVAPNSAQICTCAPPGPTEVRAARVSASGAPLETNATVVLTGSPRGVHTAASGESFLLAIETPFGVETAVARTNLGDTRVLLSPLFFNWSFGFEKPLSDVVFDGFAYVLAWHYGDGEQAWLATSHRLGSGNPSSTFLRRVDDAENNLELTYDAVAIAAGGVGAAIVSSEGQAGQPPRLKAYFDAEMPFADAPPPAPHGVIATNTYGLLEITWSPAEGAAGYAVEVFNPFGGTWLALLPTRETHLTLPGYGGLYPAVRVIAYNGNGVSAPSDSSPVIVLTPRRRATRQ
jgi:hypothetical protein